MGVKYSYGEAKNSQYVCKHRYLGMHPKFLEKVDIDGGDRFRKIISVSQTTTFV